MQSCLALAYVPYEPEVAWSKTSIRVCWGNDDHKFRTLLAREDFKITDYSEKEKTWVKEIITQEFKLQDVGIEFIGWEPCNERVTNADIVLLRFQENPSAQPSGEYKIVKGKATIGERGTVTTVVDHLSATSFERFTKSILSKLPFVLLNAETKAGNLSQENYFKMVALHEFGHSAGLRHEHIRHEASMKDPNCKRTKSVIDSEETSYQGTLFSSPYDPNSIMNYCFMNVVSRVTGLRYQAKSLSSRLVLTDETLFIATPTQDEMLDITLRIGLSKNDKHALKCMYVYDEETREASCDFAE